MKNINFEPHNFRIDSTEWDNETVDGEKYLVNPTKDIWEIAKGDCKGEQTICDDCLEDADIFD